MNLHLQLILSGISYPSLDGQVIMNNDFISKYNNPLKGKRWGHGLMVFKIPLLDGKMEVSPPNAFSKNPGQHKLICILMIFDETNVSESLAAPTIVV